VVVIVVAVMAVTAKVGGASVINLDFEPQRPEVISQPAFFIGISI